MLDFVHPNLLSLISALFIAGAQSLYRQGVRHLSPRQATLVANFSVTCFAALLYVLTEGVDRWPVMGIVYFALAGVCANLIARHANNVSYISLGLARTQILNQTEPIWSSLVAIVALGEFVTPLTVAGTLCVVFGGILLVRSDMREGGRVSLVQYAIPVAGTMCLAFAPTLRKLAFALIPSPAFGIACANLAAGFVQLGLTPLAGAEKTPPSAWSLKAVVPTMAGAVVNLVAAYLFWTAIKNGVIVEVIPIRRLSVLFVLLFSWLFFRRIERITLRVVIGALLSVAGAVAVAVSR